MNNHIKMVNHHNEYQKTNHLQYLKILILSKLLLCSLYFKMFFGFDVFYIILIFLIV